MRLLLVSNTPPFIPVPVHVVHRAGHGAKVPANTHKCVSGWATTFNHKEIDDNFSFRCKRNNQPHPRTHAPAHTQKRGNITNRGWGHAQWRRCSRKYSPQ